MDKNTKIGIAVAAIVVIAIVAVAAYFLLADEEEKETVDVNGFVDDYDGVFGEFTINEEKSTDSSWVITSVVKKYVMETDSEENSSNSVKITKYDSNDAAETAYNAAVASVAASSAMTVEIKIIEDAEGYDADEIYLKISSRNSDKVTDPASMARYSQVTGAALVGEYVIDFSQLGGRGGDLTDGSRLYYGLPIESSTVAGTSITVTDFENLVKEFLADF